MKDLNRELYEAAIAVTDWAAYVSTEAPAIRRLKSVALRIDREHRKELAKPAPGPASEPCGCKIVNNRIEYCPMHAAATPLPTLVTLEVKHKADTEEYVVVWTGDDIRDEAKCYYTPDKKDAYQTRVCEAQRLMQLGYVTVYEDPKKVTLRKQ